MSQGATEGVQTEFGTDPTTYPESWQEGDLPMPGTVTAKPSPEHANAKEQEYYLQDSEQPVKKGEHKRSTIPRP
jgi:hypothetical protein